MRAPNSTVFVSGIGCSSRFPYYMDTYGIHSIHGRAPAIASGLAVSRPDLDVWVITGDGDALSIGGNHLIHALRRNVNITILLFNNEIYGLTKGQYSPTSPLGSVHKSTPMGSIDRPVNPVSLALGAEATFVARTIDTDRAHLTEVLTAAHEHHGASFVEIYQNCVVFNDDAFQAITSRDTKVINQIPLRQGEPIIFGPDGEHAVVAEQDGSMSIVPTARRGTGSWSTTPTGTSRRPPSRCRGCRSARPGRRRSASSATSSVRCTTTCSTSRSTRRWPSTGRRGPAGAARVRQRLGRHRGGVTCCWPSRRGSSRFET